MPNLLSSFGKQGAALGLNNIDIDVEDTKESSKYFDVTEFNPVFTAGKNSVSFNGSSFLAARSEIRVECLDGDGNSLFVETPPSSARYVDMGKFTVSISIFTETVNGQGSFTLVGTLADGRSVRWKSNITINNGLQNISRVRFYDAPTLEVRPLLFPVVNSGTGSILTNNIAVTLPGNFSGQPITPALGSYVYVGQSIANTDYRISGNPVFSPQLVGQTVTVMATSILTIGSNVFGSSGIDSFSGAKTEFVNITESFTVKAIVNSNTIRLDRPFTYSPNWTKYVGKIYTEGTFVAKVLTSTLKLNYIDTAEVSSIVPVLAGNCTGNSIDPLGQKYPINRPVPITNRYVITSTSSPFVSSMVGKTININSTQIVKNGNIYVNYSAEHSAKIIEISPPSYDNHSVAVDVPFTYFNNETNEIVNISIGTFTVTQQPSNIYQNYTASNGTGSIVQKSYAEVVYRNMKPFSGVVARHKLYAKSNIYPGDYAIVADSSIEPFELLTDLTTADKSYSSIGTFLTRDQVSRYWFTNNSSSISVTQNDSPVVSSLYISAQPGQQYPDGTGYVMCKTTAVNLTNNAVYYPYDAAQFADFSGSGYTSNFISLKKDTFYQLSTNVALQKDINTQNAMVSIYFTSSNASIIKERNYRSNYGLLLATIPISGRINYKMFSDVQTFPFTPMDDYYGTLVIVPYQCNVILSNLSLKNYGDYGFSPDTGYIRIPFPINVANEAFTFKSELYDINTNLVYSTPPVVQTFDPQGSSLFGSNVLASGGSGTSTSLPTLTVNGNLFLPGNPVCGGASTNRILGINTANGLVCATNIVNISLISSPTSNLYKDYIKVDSDNPALTGKSLIVHYNGLGSEGRRIVILANGTKTTYS